MTSTIEANLGEHVGEFAEVFLNARGIVIFGIHNLKLGVEDGLRKYQSYLRLA